MRHFGRAMVVAKEQIILFMTITVILIYFAAVGIYYFEHETQPDKFASIFDSLWWSIVTLTTVGYGDVYPITVGGRLFTFMILLIGLGIVAIPTGIISSSLTKVFDERREELKESGKYQELFEEEEWLNFFCNSFIFSNFKLKMKKIFYVLSLILLSSCGVIVDYDYTSGTDFSPYKTYNYYADMKTGFNQLDEDRLLTAIDAKLQSMGFMKSDTPSFNIDIKSAQVNAASNSNVGVGIGGTGRNVGGGISIGIPVGGNTIQTEMSIEFVDDSKNRVFWQAFTTISNIGNTPDKREQTFNTVVEKILSKYPPEK